MRLSTLSPEQRRARAEELLDTVGLGERGRHLPDQLSGGEQQRSAIAVALANQPAILLADEPTGELDTATAITIYQVLQKVNHLYGTTILIVSHDAGISHQVGRVILIRDGRTSTETVRVKETDEVKTQQNRLQKFEELLMLDNVGRVQIPRSVLESLGIGGRVRLEVKEGDILLHPVDGHRLKAGTPEELDESGDILFEDEPIAEDKAGSFIQRILATLKRRVL